MSRKPFTENLSDEELDANAEQVQKDLANGSGAKHFEDLLDDINSSESRARGTNEPDAEARFDADKYAHDVRRQLKRDVNEHTISHGMRVTRVIEESGGYMVLLQDAQGREFGAELSFSEANAPAELDGRAVYKLMVETVVERALAARKEYFDRMCVTVEGGATGATPVEYKPIVVGYCEEHFAKGDRTLKGLANVVCKICGAPAVHAEFANGERFEILPVPFQEIEP